MDNFLGSINNLNIGSMFSKPGSNLVGTKKAQYEAVKTLIENGTNEMLIQPDWDVNIQCCDLVKRITDQIIITEIVALIRKKMNSKAPMKVFLVLTLIEALVKNCGEPMYVAINDDGFMKDMAAVVRKYYPLGRSGGESRDVAELSTDIMQAWGEGFLSRARQYPNISRTYHDLRKEGIQFKPDFDKTKVPTFTETNFVPVSTTYAGDDYIDSDLAAALQASLATTPANSGSVSAVARSGFHRQETLQVPSASIHELVTSASTTTQMLLELVCAFSSQREAVSNDLAEDVEAQLRGSLDQLGEAMESALDGDPKTVDLIFKTVEAGNHVLRVFADVKAGVCTTSKAKSLLATQKQPLPSQSNDVSNYLLSDPVSTTATSTTGHASPRKVSVAAPRIAALAPPRHASSVIAQPPTATATRDDDPFLHSFDTFTTASPASTLSTVAPAPSHDPFASDAPDASFHTPDLFGGTASAPVAAPARSMGFDDDPFGDFTAEFPGTHIGPGLSKQTSTSYATTTSSTSTGPTCTQNTDSIMSMFNAFPPTPPSYMASLPPGSAVPVYGSTLPSTTAYPVPMPGYPQPPYNAYPGSMTGQYYGSTLSDSRVMYGGQAAVATNPALNLPTQVAGGRTSVTNSMTGSTTTFATQAPKNPFDDI